MSRPLSFGTSIVVLLAAFAVAVTTAGAGPQRALQAPEPVASDGDFRICMDISFPPMEYRARTGSAPVGFDVDAAKAVARRWDVSARFIDTKFTGLLPALAAERCHVVWSAIFVTKDRTKRFPAVAYMKTRRALLVRAGNPERIRRPEDLSGKTAATEAGTKYVDSLRALDRRLRAQGRAGINIQTYPKASDAIQQLVVGRADAVLTQDTEAAFQITDKRGRFAIAYLYTQADTFGIYYRRDNAELGSALRRELRTLRRNGVLRGVARKHGLPAKVLQL